MSAGLFNIIIQQEAHQRHLPSGTLTAYNWKCSQAFS